MQNTGCTIIDKNLKAARERSPHLQTLALPMAKISEEGLIEFVSGLDGKGLLNLEVLHLASLKDFSKNGLIALLHYAPNLIEICIQSVSKHNFDQNFLDNFCCNDQYINLKTIKIGELSKVRT